MLVGGELTPRSCFVPVAVFDLSALSSFYTVDVALGVYCRACEVM